MENTENTEKKNNSLLVAIIIILLLCLLSSIGYIVYDKIIDKNEPKTEENKKEETKKELNKNENKDNGILVTSEFVQSLLNRININYCGAEKNNYYYNDSFKYDNYTQSQKIGAVLNNSKKFNTEGECEEDNKCYIQKSEFDKNFHLAFGNKQNTIKDICTGEFKEDCFASGTIVSYHDDKYYYWYPSGCGTGIFLGTFEKIISYDKKEDNSIEIYIQYYYYNGFIDNSKSINKLNVYSKYNNEYNYDNSKNLIGIYTFDYDDEYQKREVIENKIYNEYKNKLNTYKYTFNYDKDTKNYYFNSIEKVNK